MGYVHSHGGPSCAAFVGTALNSKACPQSFFAVKTDAACQSLAAIGGKPYGGSVNVTTFPSGCFWLTVGGGVYLNTHATGAAHPKAQQLCAGAPALPSHAQPRAADARAQNGDERTLRHAIAHVGALALRRCGLLVVTKLLLRMWLRLQGPMQLRRRPRSALSAVRPLKLDALRMARTA